jgi:deoxycytidine triphosphate deaminase
MPTYAEEYLWSDPDQGTHGILLSDRIQFYVEKVGLIEPFCATHLAPATYDLSLGLDCWYAQHARDSGRSKREMSEGEDLIMEPNSIVYVTSKEVLKLPFYLAARFNLKLRLLHEGLLVGTGPQVDPGFRGRLSIPLHNVSSQRVALRAGERFAVIEFQKTTPFPEIQTKGIREREVRTDGEAGSLIGIGGHPCLTFPSHSLDRQPVERYVPSGKIVSSSLEQIVHDVRYLEEKTGRDLSEFRGYIRTVGIISYIAVAGVALSLASYFWASVNWNRSVYDASVRAEEQVKALAADRATTQARIQELERRLAAVSGRPRE